MKTILKLVAISICMIGLAGQAQNKTVKKNDVILLKNQNEIQCLVTEILSNVIKYKKAENLDGPIYSVDKKEVFTILYKNGERESFENIAPKEVNKESNSDAKVTKSQTAPLEISESSVPTLVLTVGLYADQPENFTFPSYYLNSDLPFYKNTDFGIRSFMSGSLSSTNTDIAGNTLVTESFSLTLGAGGLYYFNKLLKLDKEKMHVYAGAALGYTMANVSSSSSSSIIPSSSTSKNDFNFIFQLGYRAYFGKFFGANIELDFNDGSALKFGVCYKFRIKVKSKV